MSHTDLQAANQSYTNYYGKLASHIADEQDKLYTATPAQKGAINERLGELRTEQNKVIKILEEFKAKL